MWQQLELASKLECDLQDTGLWQEVACWFQCWKRSARLFDWSNNTGAIDVKVDRSFFNEKYFWGWLSLLKWIGVLTLYLLGELPPRKLEPWFVLWSFFLLRFICISINLPYSHEWNTVVMVGAPSCYFEWLDKLQKQIYRTVDPSLVTSLEPLGCCQTVANFSLFFRCYFGGCSSELA